MWKSLAFIYGNLQQKKIHFWKLAVPFSTLRSWLTFCVSIHSVCGLFYINIFSCFFVYFCLSQSLISVYIG